MDVFLKKYFWVITLLTIIACAMLAGRAGAHWIEQTYLLDLSTPSAEKATGAKPALLEKLHAKDADLIFKRNIFCSQCRPEPPKKEEPEDLVGKEWVKSSLNLEVVSTMFVAEDPKWSMAVVRDMTTNQKDAMMYNKGKFIGTSALVHYVAEKRVYLVVEGKRFEYIQLPGAEDPKRAEVPVAAPMVEPMLAGNDGDGDVAKGVRCTGAQCDVDRSLVDKMLSNTAALATAARFVPSVKDGRPNGFKLYAIRPTSIFGKIGLQNGDTIKAINGLEMASPDQALGIYTKLRTASHLTVQVERRGETVTMDYTIK